MVQRKQLHSQFVKEVRGCGFLNFVLINNFLEPLTFGQSEDVFSHMPEVYVFLERFHEHENQILLGELLSLEELDELVVLK